MVQTTSRILETLQNSKSFLTVKAKRFYTKQKEKLVFYLKHRSLIGERKAETGKRET